MKETKQSYQKWFSDLNIIGSGSSQAAAGPLVQDTCEHPTRENPRPLPSVRQRKRHRGGKASSFNRAEQSLDKALAGFLLWQQSAEERLLSFEQTRLERELQAEERREQREERRAEKERQHELRLFSMLTGVLCAAKHASPAPPDPSVSLQAHLSAPQVTVSAPSVSSSPSEPLSASPVTDSTQEIKKWHPESVTACEMSVRASASKRVPGPPGQSVYLSKRGNSILQYRNILLEGFILYNGNKYHITDNPDGVINMGTSENKLCYDLLHKRLTKPDMLHVEPSLLQYTDWRGHPFLREEVAKFLTHACRSPRPLKADNLVVMNGCSSLFSCIAAAICDPKDVVLIPTPFYGAIAEDVGLYSDVKLFHVPLECEAEGKDSRPFHLTVEKLEEGLQRAKQEGLTVRAVILINPHNPLAEIYTQKEMLDFLQFAKRNELHAIVDELYMLTIFVESVMFYSVLSFDSLPDPQRTHVLWGLSKDFAMSGFRIGTLYTENQDIVDALVHLGCFHGVPGTAQHQVAQLLKDRDWINEEFLPENRRRLKAAHSYVTRELLTMGIDYIDSPAALYLWTDMRKYLREPSFEEEFRLWRNFTRHKVLISCGQAFSCSTPGYFRIVFSDQQQYLRLGMKRIREALKDAEAKQINTNSFSVEETFEESKKPVKQDDTNSDNAGIVRATLSPLSKPVDPLTQRDAPVPAPVSLAAEDLVSVGCQASNPAESLGSLIGTLRHQINSSDWLEKNTPQLSAGEDPEILDVFKALLQRAAK
ncbi:1-aminocyclopropane-1-carboxylate synthase-like protein 1 isoform X2 [Gouania willdenowi]|uniref:1-aminocyclopropane-1-carboxylate synthase-like protein 1 isoform X2 n=1 Tax=Gouania willdenowi TaxID=441366 RepID=UPI001055F3B1|nr:1-aminocyclopropane-1-carboxylate synthase-like protein 1 isoform X2 [Gouania willdenowi]